MKDGLRPTKLKALHVSQKPALELIDLINRKLLEPKNLHKPERLTIVETLRVEGWGQAKIAHLLHTNHRTVKRDIRTLRERARCLVKDVTPERVAADSLSTAEHLRQKALAAGKLELAWQITKELPELLQTFGLLYRAPEQSVVELHQKFFVEMIHRSKDTHDHVDGNGVVGPARN